MFIIWTCIFILPPEPSTVLNVSCSSNVTVVPLTHNITFVHLEVNDSFTVDNYEWLEPVTLIKPASPLILKIHQIQKENFYSHHYSF